MPSENDTDNSVRFTMVLKNDLQDRIEKYQNKIFKQMNFKPKRTEIMRQALIEFLNKEDHKASKKK